MFKIQVYTIGKSWGKKNEFLLKMAKYGKKKRDSKFTITLDFKLESHREGSNLFQSTFVIT
jgi:hypothetical protein